MWKVDYEEKAAEELAKLGNPVAKRIKKYLDTRIATNEDPRRFGEPLADNLSGLWKYRIGDYRVIADIQDELVLVLIVRIGHRRKIYGGH